MKVKTLQSTFTGQNCQFSIKNLVNTYFVMTVQHVEPMTCVHEVLASSREWNQIWKYENLSTKSYKVNDTGHTCYGLPWWFSGKEPVYQCRKCRRHGFGPWVGKSPWRRKWQPTPVFLPGESNGQRSLADYSPWGHKESGMTEHTRMPLPIWVTTEH